ncbi:MAG: TolC family outer membrane protein [Hyphomicrobiaceae bacterium]
MPIAVPDRALAESLRDALASTYRLNPRLDAERARLRATDEEIARANSGYRPTVTGSADIGYERRDTKPQSTADGETHPKGYSVNASQPVFNGFRTLNSVREAEATVRAGRETLRSVEQEVLLQAVTAYMDVVRDLEIVKLRENNVTVLSRELKATQDRFSVGEVTRTDVAQAEARRAGAVSQLDLARANLKASRATYERVVGHPPSNLQAQRPHVKLVPKSVREAVDISARESPAVVSALYREQAARHNVDKVWGELLPEVRVDANYSHRYDPSRTTDETEVTTVTGRLTVPLYQAGEVHARVRQSKHTHVSRLQEIEQARTEARERVEQAWSQLAAARGALESDQVQVNATRIALAGVREEEKVGQRTLLDVLNAEQEALNAEVSLATTQRNLVVASYTVVSAIGRLNVADLGTVEKVYDPEVHYHDVRRKWWGISITYPDGRREHHDLWDTRTERHTPAK